MSLTSAHSDAASKPSEPAEIQPVETWVFDMDGVSADSETTAMRVMDDEGVKLIKRYQPDADVPQDYIYTTYPGTSTDKIVEKLVAKYDLPEALIRQDYNVDDDTDVAIALGDQITLETIRRFETELKAIAGARNSVQIMRDTYGGDNIILCTTSRQDRMDVTLAHATDPVTGEKAGLDQVFPAGPLRISGYDVPNKYEKARTLLNLDPKKTGVVEDSESGVSKAAAALPGARIIGTVASDFYPDKEGHADKLLHAGATVIISDMDDLPAVAAWVSSGMKLEDAPETKSTVYVPDTVAGFTRAYALAPAARPA